MQAVRTETGDLEYDRSQWPDIVWRRCSTKCTNVEETPEVQRNRVSTFLRMARHEIHSGKFQDVCQVFTVDYTMRARARLRPGRAGGPDQIVVEMCKALPICAVYQIHRLFMERLR